MTRLRHALSMALLCAAVAPHFAYAQNLDAETEARAELRLKHVSGLGPALLECRLSTKDNLRCRTDRALKEVRCGAESMGSDNTEAADANARRTKIQNNLFACEKNGGTGLLSQTWSLYMLGADGSTSLWLVQASNKEQQTQAYRAEMDAIAQDNVSPFPYKLGVGGRFDATRPNEETGIVIEARQSLMPELTGRIDVVLPASQPKNWEGQLGFESQLWREAPVSPRVAFLVGYDRWGAAHERVMRNEFNLDLLILPERRSWTISVLSRAGWPQILNLRDDWAVGAAVEWAPRRERGLRLTTEVLYASRIGSLFSGEQVEARGLRARLVVSWAGGSF